MSTAASWRRFAKISPVDRLVSPPVYNGGGALLALFPQSTNLFALLL